MWVFEEDTETYWKEVTPFWRKKKTPKVNEIFCCSLLLWQWKHQKTDWVFICAGWLEHNPIVWNNMEGS